MTKRPIRWLSLAFIAILAQRRLKARLNGAATNQESDRLTVLLSVYDVERQDQEQAALIAMALTTVGAAFIGGALLFLNADCTAGMGCRSLPRILLFGLPVFPISLLGFLVQNGQATLARGRYIREIERQIADHLQARSGSLVIPYFAHVSKFVWGGGGWKNLHHGLTSSLIYTSLFAIAAGFCWVVFLHFAPWERDSFIALLLYALFILVEVSIAIGSLRAKRMRYLREQAAADFWKRRK